MRPSAVAIGTDTKGNTESPEMTTGVDQVAPASWVTVARMRADSGSALVAQPEVAERDQRVAVAPRRDVLLVQEVADRGADAAALGHAMRRPRSRRRPWMTETRMSGFWALAGPTNRKPRVA